jgi:hypothetical protein
LACSGVPAFTQIEGPVIAVGGAGVEAKHIRVLEKRLLYE